MQKTSSDNRPGRSLLLHFLLGGFSIFLGGAIYFLFRRSELPFFKKLGLTKISWLYNAREYCLGFAPDTPRWIIDSLPDGLWAFGYAVIITGIWSGSSSRVKYFWLALVPILVLGFELMQYYGLLYGTFCMQDILLSLAGIAAGYFAGKFIVLIKNQ